LDTAATAAQAKNAKLRTLLSRTDGFKTLVATFGDGRSEALLSRLCEAGLRDLVGIVAPASLGAEAHIPRRRRCSCKRRARLQPRPRRPPQR
jgi:hypothetical protein